MNSSFKDRRRACVFAAAMIALFQLAQPAWSQAEGPFYVHPAKAGDTLIHLANRYLIKSNDWQSLQKLNKIADPQRIRPGTAIRIPLVAMKTDPAPLNVVSVEGPAESAGGKLVVGSTIGEGQSIKTGDNGFVTLRLADGSTIVVQSKSQVRMEIARTIANTSGVPVTRAHLESGRLEAKVEKRSGPAARFEVTTPTSNMGVRGTQFRASSDDSGKTSRGEVVEGTVYVADATAVNSLDVSAGFGTVVEQGRAPVPPVKLLVAPDLSGVPRLQERLTLRFKFAESSGANSYRAQIAANDTFTALRAEGIFKTAEAKFGDLADGQYFLRVRAIDSLGIEGADAVVPFRLKARPEPPFASAPQNKARFSGEKVEFSWATSTDAATYRFQIARDPAFTTLVADEKSVRGSSFALAAKLNPGDYFWRAASIRADGDAGPFGDVQSFTLKPIPAAPNPPKEEGGRVGFSWGGESGQKFDFQLARDIAFKDLVMERRLDKPEITIEKPSAAGIYYMRYRAIDPDGFIAPFSSAQSFEVKTNHWLSLLLFVPFLL
ncbi:MAG: FecR domain-containing protein [Betaproteobacteria bacterium]|nr:FecR domain-containing protein [Betaproteobacteria bacterium]